VKPMVFSSEKPYTQLREHGQVTSARSEPKKDEEVWIRRTRTGEKRFEAEIYNITEVIWEDEVDLYKALYNHDLVSGFSTVHEWKKEIQRLNGGKVPNPVYIHHVVRKDHNLLREGDELLKEVISD
jgi:hypothetical protein